MVGTVTTIAPQLARYGAAGIVVNLGLYLAYLALTGLVLGPLWAASVVFVCGIPISLIAHGRFTFQVTGVSHRRKALFALGYLIGYGVQIGTLTFLTHGIGVPHQVAQLVAMVTVALVLFVFQKLWVFQA